MNFCGIDGNLTREVEVSTTTNGTVLANFSIAHNYYFNGEKKTDYYNVTAWGKLAEKVHKYAQKGTKVFIAGELSNQSYEAKDGSKRQYFKIVAKDVDILFNNTENNEKPTTNKKRSPFPSQLEIMDDGDGSLPF